MDSPGQNSQGQNGQNQGPSDPASQGPNQEQENVNLNAEQTGIVDELEQNQEFISYVDEIVSNPDLTYAQKKNMIYEWMQEFTSTHP